MKLKAERLLALYLRGFIRGGVGSLFSGTCAILQSRGAG